MPFELFFAEVYTTFLFDWGYSFFHSLFLGEKVSLYYNASGSLNEFILVQKFNFIFYVSFILVLSFILAFLSIGVRLLFNYSTVYPGSGLSLGDTNKRTPYECGFEPFSDARNTFDVKFYLVGILFLVFDLEVAFLFPWVLALPKLSFYGFWSMMFFLFILIIGFVYEWKIGGLEW